jgi:hypothetical protein
MQVVEEVEVIQVQEELHLQEVEQVEVVLIQDQQLQLIQVVEAAEVEKYKLLQQVKEQPAVQESLL